MKGFSLRYSFMILIRLSLKMGFAPHAIEKLSELRHARPLRAAG